MMRSTTASLEPHPSCLLSSRSITKGQYWHRSLTETYDVLIGSGAFEIIFVDGASIDNRKWVADFTYLWTAEGWLFSRRIVGWSMSAQMTAQLVVDVLKKR